MNLSDAQYAREKVSLLDSTFKVAVKKDWGDETGSWQDGVWSRDDLDKLHNTLMCFGECIGGVDKVGECTGGVAVFREDLGKHGGEANVHRVSFAIKRPSSDNRTSDSSTISSRQVKAGEGKPIDWDGTDFRLAILPTPDRRILCESTSASGFSHQ